MRFNRKNVCSLVLLIGFFFCASLNAEVIYQDAFDRNFVDADGVPQTVEVFPMWPRRASNLDPNIDWYQISNNAAYWTTKATAGEGLLTVITEDINSGVISYPTTDNYDFFNQELSFTFDGINIQALGLSRSASQWVKFGVVANSDERLWKNYPLFLAAVSGSGSFDLQIWQGNDRAPRKVFRSKVFNFDVSLLRKVELTMNSTNYRVKFTFENPLDVLSFGGLHNLDRDVWFVDTVGVGYYKTQMDKALSSLNTFQTNLSDAVASGIQADIDAAQANVDAGQIIYDNAVIKYDEALVGAEVVKGDSALMVSVTSDATNIVNSMTRDEINDFNANYVFGSSIGGRVTVDSVTVETTNILQ